MLKFILGIAFTLVLTTSGQVWAGNATVKEAMAEKSIGRADAPVTMIEYASLTCSHCAAFHTETLPKIKKDYIDTGKVRLVYHDFPLGSLAMAAAMVARCSGEKNFFPMIGALFGSQQSWAHSNTPLEALGGIARLSGMSEDDVADCIDNKDLFEALQNNAEQAGKSLGIQSTPTFFVEGTKVPGNLPYQDFQDILDKALAAKK